MNKMNLKYLTSVTEIMILGHWFNDEITAVLKPFKISEPQYNVLRILEDNRNQDITVSGIQNQMYKKSSNVTRMIDKLLDKGLVSREICQSNRRKMIVSLTDKGNELILKLNEVILNFHQPIRDKLTDEDCDTLTHLLKKIRD